MGGGSTRKVDVRGLVNDGSNAQMVHFTNLTHFRRKPGFYTPQIGSAALLARHERTIHPFGSGFSFFPHYEIKNLDQRFLGRACAFTTFKPFDILVATPSTRWMKWRNAMVWQMVNVLGLRTNLCHQGRKGLRICVPDVGQRQIKQLRRKRMTGTERSKRQRKCSHSRNSE